MTIISKYKPTFSKEKKLIGKKKREREKRERRVSYDDILNAYNDLIILHITDKRFLYISLRIIYR